MSALLWPVLLNASFAPFLLGVFLPLILTSPGAHTHTHTLSLPHPLSLSIPLFFCWALSLPVSITAYLCCEPDLLEYYACCVCVCLDSWTSCVCVCVCMSVCVCM